MKKTARSTSPRAALFDTLLAFAAMLGLAIPLFSDLKQVRSLDFVATDFKTLYASAAVFAQSRDAYNPENFTAIFNRDHVVLPTTWFGHQPVYPPVTLHLFAPLTRLPMAVAAQVWFGLSLACMLVALLLMLRQARTYALSWPWHLGIVAFVAASPLLAFSLDIGNVSVVAAALAIAAWMIALQQEPGSSGLDQTTQGHKAFAPLFVIPAGNLRSERHDINTQSAINLSAGLALAGALCLKPHLALWVLLGIAIFCQRRGRRIARSASFFALVAILVSTSILVGQHRLVSTFASYKSTLAHEQGSGSMAAGSREILPIAAQITSVHSLLGYTFQPSIRHLLAGCVIVVAGLFLYSLRSQGKTSPLLGISALAALGQIATYHRDHDQIVLMPIALWICVELRQALRSRRCTATAILAILIGTTIIAGWIPWAREPQRFLQNRQASIVSIALVFLMLAGMMATKKGGIDGDLSMPGGQ